MKFSTFLVLLPIISHASAVVVSRQKGTKGGNKGSGGNAGNPQTSLSERITSVMIVVHLTPFNPSS